MSNYKIMPVILLMIGLTMGVTPSSTRAEPEITLSAPYGWSQMVESDTEPPPEYATIIDQRLDPRPITKPPRRWENRRFCRKDSDCGFESCRDINSADGCPSSAISTLPGCTDGSCVNYESYERANTFCIGNTLHITGRCTVGFDLDGNLHWLLGQSIDCGEPPPGVAGPTCVPIENPACGSVTDACLTFAR